MTDAPITPATPIVDAQDPLPESNWFWRRVFTFVVTGCILWMIWGAINRLGTVAVVRPEAGISALLSLCKMLLWVLMANVTYYMVAPSAEQISKMLQTTGLLKSGIKLATTTVSTATPDSTTTTTATAAGKPPIEPIPAEPPATIVAPDAPAPEPEEPDVASYRPPMADPEAAGDPAAEAMR